jgi:F-type H+-transporting ATPase subunit epsilon
MADTLYVEIVAPDKRVFQGEAESLRAPGLEGSFQVLYNHAPMIAAIDVGPLIVVDSRGERITFATSGGFVEVLNNTVTVLAETVEPSSDIDVDRAKASEERARERLEAAATTEDRQKAETALERARNRVRVAMGEVAA